MKKLLLILSFPLSLMAAGNGPYPPIPSGGSSITASNIAAAGGWTNIVQAGGTINYFLRRLDSIQFLPSSFGGNLAPYIWDDTASDFSSYWIQGSPTNNVNGQYVFKMFTNDPNLGSAYAYTNVNGLFTVWFPWDQSLFYAEDTMLLPSSVQFPNDETAADAFAAATVLKKHNLRQPISYPASWYNNANIHYTNMLSDWNTNYFNLSFGTFTRSADYSKGFTWGPNTINPRTTYVCSFTPDSWAVSTPYSFASNGTRYTNGPGAYTLIGNVVLGSSASAFASMTFTEVEVLGNSTSDVNLPAWRDATTTNSWTIGKQQSIAATNTYIFNVPISSGAVFWFTTNNQSGASSYITNVVVHN